MRLEDINIKELNKAPYNPRTITKEEFRGLIASIKAFGIVDPVIVNKDMTIIGGHQRLEACKELGYESVPCVVLDLNKKEEKKLNVILNSQAISGHYDQLKLDEILEELKLDTDYEELRLNELESIDLSTPQTVEDGFEIPQKDKYSVKLGDRFKLDDHIVMCGDSTDLSQVGTLLQGEIAPMIFTDPPYLMGFTGNVHADGTKSFNAKHGAILNDKMSIEEGIEFITKILNIIKNTVSGSFYICFYRLGLQYVFKALEENDLDYHSVIIWDKGNHTLSNSDYMSKYEPIVYGWIAEHNFYGDRSNFDIWEVARTQKNDLHPTMKPIELCAKAINNSSQKGDLVLDLFGGSGSTLIACEQLGRRGRIMELDPHYASTILERWEKFTGKTVEKL